MFSLVFFFFADIKVANFAEKCIISVSGYLYVQILGMLASFISRIKYQKKVFYCVYFHLSLIIQSIIHKKVVKNMYIFVDQNVT